MPQAGHVIRTSDVNRVIAFEAITANSADIGTTETVVLTLTAVPFENGRAYEFRISTLISCSSATGRARITVHKTNAAGASYINFFDISPPSAGGNTPVDLARILNNTSGTDVTMDIAFTLDEVAGSGTCRLSANTTNAVGFAQITDVGPSDDYPGMNTVS